MIFTSFDFLIFLALMLAAHWWLRGKRAHNLLLLVGSYVFYGYVHPWFCLLIAASTLVDYWCGRAIVERPRQRNPALALSVTFNLSLLGFFKYFDFFVVNMREALHALGVNVNLATLDILLPVGISFYTFQTLSYTIDIHQGRMRPTRDLLSFAVFVAFFPQLVAGPIERARRLLPQLAGPRHWDPQQGYDGMVLILRGFAKKLIVADGIAPLVDKLFLLESPSPAQLYVAALAFAIQILADFSAYTDIARGVAKLFGVELIENFNAPYLAISPSDFWRRWHISFSSWIRDYLYIPLGGSRVGNGWRYLPVLVVTMGLSGLWHGAAWHFVAWGVYHALILYAYHRLGLGGHWQPATLAGWLVAWLVMVHLTLFGWLIFRAPDLAWLASAIGAPGRGGAAVSLYAALLCAIYLLVLALLPLLGRLSQRSASLGGSIHAGLLAAIVLLHQPVEQDFIYFQF